MDSFLSLPQEIINQILMLVPFHMFRKCKDEKGDYFPIIDQFVKETYISEYAMFKTEYFLHLDYLFSETIYKSYIKDIVDKITLSYTHDFMKLIEEHRSIIKSDEYIDGTPVSLIVFCIKQLKFGKTIENLLVPRIIRGSDSFIKYGAGGASFHQYCLDEIQKQLSSMLLLTILLVNKYVNKICEIQYKSIEIVKIFYPHGFDKQKFYDTTSPLEETVLIKYL